MLKRLVTGLLIITSLFALPFSAQADKGKRKALDQVVFQMSAERWVTTQTAKVYITIDATLNNRGLQQIRKEIMTNLDQLANAEWHLTQFDRKQDRSGLEALHVQAEARVLEKELQDIRKTAKDLTKPGATYRVSNIEFTPSQGEIEKTRTLIRDDIYQRVNAEVDRLNKVYPDQDYSVHRIDFVRTTLPQRQQMKTRSAEMLMTSAADSASLTVSNKIIMTALIKIASNRDATK